MKNDGVNLGLDIFDVENYENGNDQLIISLDDEMIKTAERIDAYKNGISEQSLNQLFNRCESMVIETIIGPFGLTQDMFNDQTGGSVTTLHNFEKGITATSNDKERYDSYAEKYVDKTKNFDRKEYEGARFKNERKRRLKSEEPLLNAYGKDGHNQLNRDGSSHLDHVVSAHEIDANTKFNLLLSKEERVDMALDKTNLAMTDRSANQSKSDSKMEDWLEKTDKTGLTKAEKYNIDKDKAIAIDKKARDKQTRTALKAQIRKQGSELAITGATIGLTLGGRQLIGVLLKQFLHDSIFILKDCIKKYRNNSYSTIKQFLSDLAVGLKRMGKNLMNKFGEAFDAFKAGFKSGFLSNLVTFLINQIITTSKNIVAIIREGGNAIYRAIDILLDKDNKYNRDEKIEAASDILVSGLLTCIGIAMTEAVSNFLLTTPLAPFREFFSNVIIGLFVGFTSILAIFVFMSWKNKITKSHNDVLAVHNELYMNNLQMSKTTIAVINSYKNTAASFENAVNELGDLDWDF